MAKTDEKVMQFVEDELKKNPDVDVSDLHERAKKVSPGVSKLTLRQFNARYPLQVRRRQSQTTGGAKPKRRRRQAKKKAAPRARRRNAAPSGDREAVRGVLLKFASDVAAAEKRQDLVKVVSDVDRYVEQVLKAAR